MVAESLITAPNQLCTVVSKANGEQPIGSAATFQQCLILELPQPWPRDAFQAEHLPQAIKDLLSRIGKQGIQVRPQAILPDPEYSVAGYTRVILYRCPPEKMVQYQKVEYLVPQDQVLGLLEALFEHPENLSYFANYEQQSADVRDLLVCTHGVRDTCCGKFGIPLYQTLRNSYAPPFNGNLRVWRTSHTGGHRFAPTLIDLPTGHYWGRLEPNILDALIYRTGDVADLVADYYRGLSALTTLEQVAEREIWLAEGWPWLTYQKSSHILAYDEEANRAEIRVDFIREDGQTGTYQTTVEQRDTVLTLPSSGSGPLREEARYQVRDLVRQI